MSERAVPTREEKNGVIAEWVEPEPDWRSDGVWRSMCWAVPVWIGSTEFPYRSYWEPLDFYTSEEASALAFEAMPEPELWLESDKGKPKLWGCVPDMGNHTEVSFHADRKTAIAEAAYLVAVKAKESK